MFQSLTRLTHGRPESREVQQDDTYEDLPIPTPSITDFNDMFVLSKPELMFLF